MAGIPGKGGVKGRSGPPSNQNAFKHGLAAIQKRREESITTEYEESIRQQIVEGLISDKGRDDQVSTATRILAEVIASDATWLMVFNRAIDRIIANNHKVRENPRGLSQLDGFQALRDKTLYVRPPTNREAWWHPLQITPEADSHCILAGDVNVMFCPFRTKLTACLTRS